ncbi:SUMF1/EgtB/PvdO family nonheme iron enzyme [Bacteroidales bacterium]|nr:SUMF1/EgtB/PvdO family nonheme iron enzyme [Bacteroidales bacterium]
MKKIVFAVLFILYSNISYGQQVYTPESAIEIPGHRVEEKYIFDKMDKNKALITEEEKLNAIVESCKSNNAYINAQIKNKEIEITEKIVLMTNINNLPTLNVEIQHVNKLLAYLNKQSFEIEKSDRATTLLYGDINNLNQTIEQTKEARPLNFKEQYDNSKQQYHELQNKYNVIKQSLITYLSNNQAVVEGKSESQLISQANKLLDEQIRKLKEKKLDFKNKELIVVSKIPVLSDTKEKTKAIITTIKEQDKTFNNIMQFNPKVVVREIDMQKIYSIKEYADAKRNIFNTWVYVSDHSSGQQLTLVSQYRVESDASKKLVIRKNYNEVIEGIMLELVYVEGGSYHMGSPSSDQNSQNDERPVHKVNIKSLFAGKFEVTQEQWVAVMGDNPSINKGCNKCPVENVSINDVEQFLVKLNEKTGKEYRLPSEAEWEYLARGGQKSMGYLYSGSNSVNKVSNHEDNCKEAPKTVGSKKPNEIGLYDMSGNVWEWVQDRWHDNYKGAPVDGSAWLDGGNPLWVNRGGSCGYKEQYHRIGNRNDDHPGKGRDVVGFRLVLSAE